MLDCVSTWRLWPFVYLSVQSCCSLASGFLTPTRTDGTVFSSGEGVGGRGMQPRHCTLPWVFAHSIVTASQGSSSLPLSLQGHQIPISTCSELYPTSGPPWQSCLLPLNFSSREGSPQSLTTNATGSLSHIIPTLVQEIIMCCYPDSTGEETASQAAPPFSART